MKTKTKSFPKNDELVEVEGWGGNFLLGKNHSYWWKEEKKDTEPKLHPLSGVTSVLGVINKPALVQWAANQSVAHIKESATVRVAGTDPLTDVLYEITAGLLEEARTAHTKKKEAAGEKGTDAHALIEQYVRWLIERNKGEPIILPAVVHDRVREFSEWAVKEKITFLASETPLADFEIAVAGTPDFIAEKDGKVIIGDIKTGSGIYDRTPFLQMAAYASMYKKKENVKDDWMPSLVIIHAPASKPDAMKPHWSHDCEGDYKLFLNALGLYRGINNPIE